MLIESVKRKYENQLLQLPNVCGVGIGEQGEKTVIKVFVKQKLTENELHPQDIVPKILDEYETDVEEIGDVTTEN